MRGKGFSIYLCYKASTIRLQVTDQSVTIVLKLEAKVFFVHLFNFRTMPGIKETNNIRLQLAEVRDSNGNTHLKLDSDGLTELDNEGQVVKNHGEDDVYDSASASADGTTGAFTLSHSLGAIPQTVIVTPTSAEADGNFYVSNKTSNDIEVTYANAVAGSGTLSYDLYVSA